MNPDRLAIRKAKKAKADAIRRARTIQPRPYIVGPDFEAALAECKALFAKATEKQAGPGRPKTGSVYSAKALRNHGSR